MASPLWLAGPSSPAVIYTVSVADVWTKEQTEIPRQQFAARDIDGVVHKVKKLGERIIGCVGLLIKNYDLN